jgi:hypothetical protein
METVNFTVRQILDSDDKGYSRVILGYDTFQALRGANPDVPFETKTASNGERVRKFTVATDENDQAVHVWSLYRRDEEGMATTFFFMLKEVAKDYLESEQSLEFDLDEHSFEVIPSPSRAPQA